MCLTECANKCRTAACFTCIYVLISVIGCRNEPSIQGHSIESETFRSGPASEPVSPFLNTREGQHVNSQMCSDCHTSITDSFQKSGMGNSFSRVEPEKEPDGGALNHHLSGRRYEATRRATELVHRELQLPDAVIDPTRCRSGN